MSSDDFALLDDSDLRLPEDAVDERFAELFEKQNATVRTINEDLEAVVIRQLDEYFAQLEGRTPHPLYDLVVHAVERPLIEYAMSMCHRNQCAAAQLLGINRNTLRKKLLSVSDKVGIVDFARGLVSKGYHILSTGGTAKLLAKEGVEVEEVADYTGFP